MALFEPHRTFAEPKLFFIGLLCAGTVLLSTIFGLYITEKENAEEAAFQTQLRREALHNLRIACTSLVWELNEIALRDALIAQKNLPDLLGIRIFTTNPGGKELLAEVANTGFSWEKKQPGQTILTSPLLRGKREIGTIEVAFSNESLKARGQERMRRVLLQNAFFALVLFVLFVLFVIQRRVRTFLEKQSSELAAANRELEREIEQRNQLERSLRQSRDEARNANRVKQEFLANMSHELRTPLNGILGICRMLDSRPDLNETEREYLTLLQESSESLQGHLDDILTYTALETGKLALRETKFELPILLEEITARANALCARKGLECKIDVAGGMPVAVIGDRHELRRGLLAIIHNAVKFTPKGAVEIRISWLPDQRRLRLFVKDSGPGIPADAIPKIYQPFVQLDTSAARRHSGLGLGLALASKVVTIAGGEMRCLNPGQPGAEFELLFPLVPVAEDSGLLTTTGSPGMAQEEPATEDFRILIVDDNDLNRRVLRIVLSKAGLSAAEATCGQEALDALASQSFDLVFMDVQMPVMDGLEATRKIRASFPEESQPFIIALTAHALPSDRQLCLDAGMDEYLSKPVDAERLLRWVHRLQTLPRHLRYGLSATRRKKPEPKPA